MKVYVATDERYPDFAIRNTPIYADSFVEVSKEKRDEWFRVAAAYDKMQQEVEDAMAERAKSLQ